jgi:transposase-like protein
MTKEEKRIFWTEKISKYRSSGQTAKAWSKDNDLSVHALRYWIIKFNKENKSNESVEFKPLIPEITASPKTPIKISFGPAVIELTNGFDEIAFERIVTILSRTC